MEAVDRSGIWVMPVEFQEAVLLLCGLEPRKDIIVGTEYPEEAEMLVGALSCLSSGTPVTLLYAVPNEKTAHSVREDDRIPSRFVPVGHPAEAMLFESGQIGVRAPLSWGPQHAICSEIMDEASSARECELELSKQHQPFVIVGDASEWSYTGEKRDADLHEGFVRSLRYANGFVM